MEDEKIETNNIEAGVNDSAKYNWDIKEIPVDKIVEHKSLYKGIRDEEKYDGIVESIKKFGLLEIIGAREQGDKYELGMGHHRFLAVKQIGWKTIRAKIFHIEDDMLWAEMVIEDNLKRANYSSNQLEEQIFILWEQGRADGRYSTFGDIGERFGFSETWIRRLIEGREIRTKINKDYNDVDLERFSAETLIEAKKIEGDRKVHGFRDFVALLKLSNEKKYKPCKIKTIAQDLKDWPKELRDKVLYEKESYDKIKFDLQHKANKETPKAKKSTNVNIKQANPHFIIDTYSSLDENLKTFFTTLDKRDKEKSLRYIKVMITLLGKFLLEQQYITLVHYRQISDDILGVKISPHKYDGSRDLERLGKFLNSYAENLEIQSTEETNQEGQ